MAVLLKGGTIVNANGTQVADLLICGEKIAKS
jgi:dihydroorotase-like cyclic amidohydrolase